MPTSRRRPLLPALAGVALLLLLAGTLLWKGRWGVGQWRGEPRAAAGESGDGAGAVLWGREDASTAAGAGAGPGVSDAKDTIADCAVKGRVVDAETGEPVSEAAFILWSQWAAWPKDPFSSWLEATEGDREAMARVTYAVDADGRFGLRGAFAGVGSGEPLFLFLVADGYQPHLLTLEIPGTHEIRVHRGETLRGRVVDEAGHPLPGATVTARVGWTQGPWTWGPVCAWVRTGADGVFEIEGLPGGQASLVQAEAGFRRSRAEMAWPGQDPVLVVGGPVRVTVDVSTADGGGMPFAYVSSAGRDWGRVLWESGWAEPPIERRIDLLPLPPGPLPESLLLCVPGYTAASIPLDDGVPDQRHALVLGRPSETSRIRVRLTWPEAGAEHDVFVRVRDGSDFLAQPYGIADRAAVRHVVPPGTPEISLALAWETALLEIGGLDVGYQVTEVRTEGRAETITLDLRSAGALEVVLPGAGVAGAGVRLWWTEDDVSGRERVERRVASLQREVSELEEVAPDERLPNGFRWSEVAIAEADGTGAAVARLHGLAPRRYELRVLAPTLDVQDDVTVEVVAGETTRVVVPRREEGPGSAGERQGFPRFRAPPGAK